MSTWARQAAQVSGHVQAPDSVGELARRHCAGRCEVDLAFQRVEDYRPPRWPDDEHPKQYHLDFEVDQIEPEQRRVIRRSA
jgi:hypothetical protein